MRTDFKSYGAYKSASARQPRSFARAIGRALGLKNRYLKFLSSSKRDELLVEIGCGSGKFLEVLKSAGFSHVVGVEPSTSYADVPAGVQIFRCTAQEYLQTIQEGTVGTILALDVFEHIPKEELIPLMSMFHARLKGDGIVVFRVPNMASPLALTNYYGDLTHVTALNEFSIRQLAFQANFDVQGVHDEPLARPQSIGMMIGIVLWILYKNLVRAILSSFGIHSRILTPNLVCVLKKVSS